MRSLLNRVILVVCFFSFITLNISCHSLLACRVSVERLAISLMEVHFYAICCFSLAAFNICSLCLIFVTLINMCLSMFILGFILYGMLWASWTWVAISFPILGKFSMILFSHIFSCTLFWSYFSGMLMILMLGLLIIVPEVSETIFICFYSFILIPLCFSYFYHPAHLYVLLPH